MPSKSRRDPSDPALLDEIKMLSGRAIEERRRRARTTQEQLADRTGIGARWIREIESGNPSSSIEHHIRCASALGLPLSYMLIPLLFMENDMSFPLAFLVEHYPSLEDRCIRSIGDYYVETVARQVRPEGRNVDLIRRG